MHHEAFLSQIPFFRALRGQWFIAACVLCLAVMLIRVPTCAADGANVYLFAGQSNMWGTGNGPKDLTPDLAAVDEKIRTFTTVGKDQPIDTAPLQNGVNNNWAAGEWGSEAELMHRLAAVAKETPIYMLKFSAGGSWLAERPATEQNDWNPRSHDELLDGFTTNIAKAKKNLEDAGKEPRFKGFIWMQGESDSNDAEAAKAYQADLETLIARVRDAAASPDMPVYIGRIHKHYSGLNLQTVRANQARVAAAGKNIYMFDTDDLPLHDDHIHFNADAQIAIGDTIFDLMTGALKLTPCEVAPDQSFTVREFAAPGTPVGLVTLSKAGSPTPTFVVDNPAFAIDGMTGQLSVKDLAGIDYSKSDSVKVSVSAINGVAPTSTVDVTVHFRHAKDSDDRVATRYMIFDPDAADSVSIDTGVYAELRSQLDPARVYTAEHRPIQDKFPGTDKQAMKFDGTQMMTGPSSDSFLKPAVDENLTLAMVVHPVQGGTATPGWCAVVNKGTTEPSIGIGYDYTAQKFVFSYANGFNGAIQMLSTDAAFPVDQSYVVRLRKVADACQLFVNGKLAAEVHGKDIRNPILADGEGAVIGLGGMFPPSPTFVGSIGKIVFITDIPTTQEETTIDKELADWGKVALDH